jgi:hypothetical protein
MMIAEVFDRIVDAVDDDAGIGPDDFIDDDFTITRRRLCELIHKELGELDRVRLETMVNTRDAVYMVVRRLAPLIDDCVAQGILDLPSVPRPRRQRTRTGQRSHRKSRQTSVQRGAA